MNISPKGFRFLRLSLLAVFFNFSSTHSSHAFTPVSRIPALDYGTAMSVFVKAPDGTFALPQLDGGTIWHLAFDGWEWRVQGEYDPLAWTGNGRLNPQWTRATGDQFLVMGSDPGQARFFVPRLNVLERVNGEYQVSERVTLAPLLDDPSYYDYTLLDLQYLENLVVLKGQVGVQGVGGKIRIFTLVKKADGWRIGPSLAPESGYWWGLFSERAGEDLHFRVLSMTGSYNDNPWPYSLIEYVLSGDEWVETGEFTFHHDGIWAAGDEARALLSPDGQSMIVHGSDGRPSPRMELRRSGNQWAYVGDINGGGLDFADLYFQHPAGHSCLMRRNELSHFGDTEPQHFHMLHYREGNWELSGDLVSPELLKSTYQNEFFFVQTATDLTFFNIPPYHPEQQWARSYDPETLTPRLVSWFREAETLDSVNQRLEALGFYQPQVSADGRGLWIWHWNLGWLFLTGRDSDHFWFWNHAYGWAWFDDLLFNMEKGLYWLYDGSQQDFLWLVPQSADPRYFYSYGLGEWLSDTVAPPVTEADVTELLDLLKTEIETPGVTVEVDYPNRLAIITAEDTVEGDHIVVRFLAPFQYLVGQGYACIAHFEVDLSWIEVTINEGEPAFLHSTQFWTDAQVRLPMQLVVDFILHTEESGIALQTTYFNDGSMEGPIREPFP